MEEKTAKRTIRRIAITGPESTGKTLLCSQLAEYFNEPWVPEYSREYLESIHREYTYNDILLIAQGQYEKEVSIMPLANRYLFCDTDFIVTRIWSMVKYGKSHEWIDEQASSNLYDFTLLCNIDLPWEYDPLREHPQMRQELFQMYLEELSSRNIPHAVIHGSGNERLQYALTLLAEQGIHK